MIAMSQPWRNRGASLLAYASLLACALTTASWAQPPSVAPAGASESPLTYRRVFVPAERTAEWPIGTAPYLPMERSEFERLVEQAEERRQLSLPGSAQLVRADYVARLAEGDSLAGVAAFEVELIDDRPTVLSLAPWNAVVLGANWSEGDAADSTPATIGLWARPAGRGSVYGLLVDRPGQAEVEWQLAPEQLGSNLEFALALPPAVSQRLTLELPSGVTPTLSSGQLLKQEPSPQGRGTLWTFQLAGGAEHRLHLRRPAAGGVPGAAARPLVAITEAYHLTADGVDYDAELRLQERGARLAELRLVAPSTLHIAAITVNRRAARWRRDPEDASSLLIALPSPAESPSSAPATVAISAAAAGTFDAPWQLPRVAAPDLDWTEGTSTLWIDPGLELQSLVPRDCSLLHVVGIGAGAEGEVYRLQAWSPEAVAEVVVGDRRATLRHRRGVRAEFADREIVAQVCATVRATGGKSYHVAARLADDWNIESVAVEPADALVEWHVDEGVSRMLHLQLRRSPTEATPLGLAISARKSWRAWTRTAPLSDLDLLQFEGIAEGSWLLAKDRRGNEVLPDAKLAEAIAPAESLPGAARELLGDANTGLVIDLRKAKQDALVSVAATAASFSGEGWMELAARADGYEHRAEILCRPASGAISELRLLAARALPPDAAWNLVDGPELVAERIGAAPAAAERVSGSVEYRLRLPQARSDSFRLQAVWRSSAVEDAAVNLLSLPDAVAWQAWAIFRGNPQEVAVDSGSAAAAVALPARTTGSRGRLPAIGCYRLGDDPSVAPAKPPTLVARPSVGAANTDVIAWNCWVDTQQFADGTQTHRVAYQIESHQPADVELTAPRGATFTSVTLESRPLVAPQALAARTIRFSIPGSAKRQMLVVDFERTVAPLARDAVVRPALLRASFPVARSEWTLQWPAAYHAERPAPSHQSAGESSAPAADWLARLCGPLSGRGERRWYDGMLLAHVDAAPPILPPTATGAATPGGWSALTQTFVERPVPVTLRLASGEQAKWHVAWLVAAVAAAWLWARSQRATVMLAVAAATLCLVVPESLIPLPQAAFLGLVTGALVRRLVSFLTKSRPDAAHRTRGGVVKLAVVLAATTIGLLPVASVAQPAIPAAAATAPEKIPAQVLFPVDDAGRSVGADVYVPAALAAEILPAAAKGPAAALVEAHYLVELQAAGAGGDVIPRKVQVRLRLQTRRPQVQFEAPLAANEAAIDPGSLLLDGQPLPLAWNAAGNAIVAKIPQAGVHEIVFAASPLAVGPVSDDPRRSQLRLGIPPLPGGSVEVIHPAGLGDVRAAGGLRSASQSNAARTTFKLPPSALLQLTWPRRLAGEPANVTLEQLSWLDVDPVGARLEVRLRLSGESAGVNGLRLLVSPQLKLLPLPDGSPLEADLNAYSEPNASGAVELHFRAPPQLPLTVALQFQLQRTVSVGRFDYPWVEVAGMNVRRRHFVVSADPRLRLRDSAASDMTPATPAEIEPLWGPAIASASLRYNVAGARPDWSLEVTPAPTRYASRDSLELYCDEQELRVVYAAAVTEVAGEILVHRLVVSPDLAVDNVTASVDGPGESLPVRWARPQADQVLVFLSRPLSEPHTLRLEGRVRDAVTAAAESRDLAVDARSAVVERSVQVPRIALEASQNAPIDATLFRTGDVLVDWVAAPPPSKPPASSPDASKGLLVGQFALARGAAPQPELRITPNDAQYDADALLTLHLEGVEPIAQCRLEGNVTRGVVDRFRFVVGKNWRGPFACEPPARVVRRDLAADSSRQQIDVRLARPIPAGESFSLTISGPVALEADQRVRFPTLRLANARRLRTYLILPPTAGNLTAEWTLRGLQSQPLPESLAAALDLPQPPPAYRVERERFVAEQRVFPDAMRSAAYRLVETNVGVDSDGSAVAISQAIVQAGGGDECRVILPPGSELLYAAVDGVAQTGLAEADGAWLAPVGSRFLPRAFLFSYRLPKFQPNAPRRFAPPQVTVDDKSLLPQTSLWRIADAASLPTPLAGGQALSAAELATLARRRQIEAFLDAYPLASQLAEWELRLWRQPWIDRLGASEALLGADDPDAWVRLRERSPATSSAEGADHFDPLADWLEEGSAAAFAGDEDGCVTLPLRMQPWPIARWLSALALAAAIGVAWRQPAALRSLTFPMQRWPYVALAGAGLLWWCYLAPSLLGLLIIGFAMAAYVKSRR
jgi:hypothetical protein